MATLPIHQLDVFTNRALGGNPLAVFPEPGGIDSATMQALARETNLSETTFITARDDERHVYTVRIFTPLREIPFAGHPTIGTAWLLFQECDADVDTITLDLGVGMVAVRIDRSASLPLVYFAAPTVTPGKVVDDLELLGRLYGLKPEEFALAQSPAHIVTYGISFLITPVVSREALERVSISIPAVHELADIYGCDLVTAFSMEAYQRGSTASTRVFAPLHGVPEDPATGSSASCLAFYLRHHGLIPDCGEDWLKLDQGYSCARPSLLHLRANKADDGSIEVNIGGSVVPVASGEYSI
jgi:trans-2,3-dihydro-3-hydroxyanthranilate isomerase